MDVQALILATILLSATNASIKNFNNKTESRDAKLFSLFSIVQFPNLACTTTSGTYTNGTCFTVSECNSKGGTTQGSCAAGFGVCCIFVVSGSNSVITENCTYIVNPSYPSSYVPTSTPSTLTYTIDKSQSDICRIRLDYDTFELTSPKSGAAATEGQCTADKLVLTTTAENYAPDPTSTTASNFGNYPMLCGTNSGLHSYLDVSQTEEDTATLTFTIGDATTNTFKIKVSMLSCNDYHVSKQQNCFQYFTGINGLVSSYNYAQPQLLAAQQYTNCIRQEEDHCCIEWTVTSFKMAGGRADGPTGTACNGAAAATLCSDGQGCSSDFVLIPNSGAAGQGQQAQALSDRYCGPALSPFNSGNSYPVISCDLPFVLGVQTGGASCGAAAAINCENSLFQLKYRQIPGTC